MMKKLLLGVLLSVSLSVNAESINLGVGDVHVDESRGSFITRLNGDYLIVLRTVYEDETIDVVIVDNKTGKTVCVPRPCNYN